MDLDITKNTCASISLTQNSECTKYILKKENIFPIEH